LVKEVFGAQKHRNIRELSHPAREARRGNFGVFGAQKHNNIRGSSDPAREARRENFGVFGAQKHKKQKGINRSGARSAPGKFWGIRNPKAQNIGGSSDPAREARRENFGVFGAQKHKKHKGINRSGARSAPGKFWGIRSPKAQNIGGSSDPAREARRENFGVFGAQKHRNIVELSHPAREARRDFFWGIWSPKSTKS
jgi:hypothetical protein